MFGLFQKKYSLVTSGILKGMTDIHSHVLPGVDDGSPDLPTSLELLAWMETLGWKKIWCTPHVMEDFQNHNPQLEQTFQALQQDYSGNLELALASEYMLDASFSQRLPKQVLPIGKNHLLVETSYMYGPAGMDDLLLDIYHAGYHPIIAHPERYMYMEETDYRSLKEKGYSFQLNLMSLSGYYGRRPQAVSEDLLKKGWYDYVGSDLHHLHRYAPIMESFKLKREQIDALGVLLENNQTL